MSNKTIENYVVTTGVADAEVVATGEGIGVAGAEVIDAEVVVRAGIQFILPSRDESIRILQTGLTSIQNTLTLHTGHLETISNRVINDIESIDSLEVLYDIRDKLNKRIHIQAVEVSYMRITDMALNLSVSKSFLEKNMGEIFIEGTHYIRIVDARLVRWDVEQMHKWVKGDRDETDKQLLSKLLD